MPSSKRGGAGRSPNYVDNNQHSQSLAHLLFGSRSPLGRGWSLLLAPSLTLAQLSQALPHADGHLRAQAPDKYAARVEPQHWVRTLEVAVTFVPTSQELARRSKPPSTARPGPTKKYPYVDPLPRDTMRGSERRSGWHREESVSQGNWLLLTCPLTQR